ncbi:MAG TPA: hypothetical protein VIG24_09165 [Acidimicrobiia bacterium]
MAGRHTDTDVDVVQETGSKGRASDSDVDVLRPIDPKGRFIETDVDVIRPGVVIGDIEMGPGGWGFIPIGTFVDRSVYIDGYADLYGDTDASGFDDSYPDTY